MDRRNFIRTTGTLIAGARLASHTLAESSIANSGAGRLVLPINRGWRFSSKPVEHGHEKEFDDSNFERVVVPHANVRLPWHGFDEKQYEFVSLYRRRFRLPKEAQGKRVFVDFEGVMTASTVWINGEKLGEYEGGYTPFSFELTPHIDWDGENVLAVDVDSTERPDIPPFGYEIDYLTFGGLYREVALRIVPANFLENIFVRTKDVLSARPSVEVECAIENPQASRQPLSVEVELLDGDQSIGKISQRITLAGKQAGTAPSGPASQVVHLDNLPNIKLWNLENRNLYRARVRLIRGKEVIDEDARRFGFREAQFTDHGFELNGKVIKLRGLDRHQTFPFVGQAMPGRAQRRHRENIRKKVHSNIGRKSNKPK
jgi:beta-galactosidase